MRRLLLFLLLLPLSLVSQVKILMPVVVKDASGKAVTDLKASDFPISRPKNIRLADMSLVSPQSVADADTRNAVVVIYDAANLRTNAHELNVQELRNFLREVADHRLPVTLLVNTEAGLRLIYNSRIPPEVLSEALTATAQSKPKTPDVKVTADDAQVQQQAENLKLLDSAVWIRRSGLSASQDQMNSLIAFAHLVQRLPGRKAVIWVTTQSPVGATENPAYLASNANPWSKPLLPMYEGMIEELNAAHVSIYPVLFNGANPIDYGDVWDSWTSLKQLAASTGGLAFKPGEQISFKQNSFLAAAESTLGDLGPYYMLAVEVPAPKELDWIPVKIKVTRPSSTVRAAPGFLSLKPVKTH